MNRPQNYKGSLVALQNVNEQFCTGVLFSYFYLFVKFHFKHSYQQNPIVIHLKIVQKFWYDLN